MRLKHWPESVPFGPPAASADDPMTITGFKAWRLREPVSNRRYTVVKVESRSGAAGYGEGGAADSADLVDAKTAVVGRRATDNEHLRHRLAARPNMEAAVNNALIDLVATAKGVPIYQYFGGPTRFKARLIARLEGNGDDDLVAALGMAKQNGFRAFAFPVPTRDEMWRMQAYVDELRKRLETLKTAAGPNMDFVLDGGGMLTPGDASFLAKAFERDHMMWFDEPTETLTNDALARLSEETVMPVGLTRHAHDIQTFQNLLRWGRVDIIRPNLALNSMCQIRRQSAVAETHYVSVGPYHNGGPLGTVAGIHLNASLPDSFALDVPLPRAAQDRAMRAELIGSHETATEGFAMLINKPGLGVEVNEQALTRYSEEVL